MSKITAFLGLEPSTSKSVDGVMSAFHDTIEKLHDVADHHNSVAADAVTEMAALEAKRAASAAESQRALDIAQKMAAVVGYQESKTLFAA
jgi:uncharacterized protein YoxC